MAAQQPPVPPPPDDEDEPIPGEVELSAEADEPENTIELAGQANDPNDPNRSRKKTKIRQKAGDQNASNKPLNPSADSSGLSWERIGNYFMGALSDVLATFKRAAEALIPAKSKNDQKAQSDPENAEAEEDEALEEEEEMEQNANNANIELEADAAKEGAGLAPRLTEAEVELEELSDDGLEEDNANPQPPVLPAATNAAARAAEPRVEPGREVPHAPEPANHTPPRPNPRNRGSTG